MNLSETDTFMYSKMRIAQLNVRKTRDNVFEFIDWCVKENIDVGLIQEVPPNFRRYKLKNYKVFISKDHELMGFPSIATIIFNSSILVTHSTYDVYTINVSIQNAGEIIDVVNFYNRVTDKTATDELFHVVTNRRKYLVVAGDFNCSSLLWDVRETANACNIISIMKQGKMICRSKKDEFTRVNSDNTVRTVIDLVWASKELNCKVVDVVVKQQSLINSDHYPIITILNSVYGDQMMVHITSLRKLVPWIKENTEHCDNMMDLTYLMIKGKQLAMTSVTAKGRVYNKEVRRLKKKKDSFRKIYNKRRGNKILKAKYNKASKELKVMVKKIKMNTHLSIQKNHSKSVWDEISLATNNNFSTLLHNGVLVNDRYEMNRIIMDHRFQDTNGFTFNISKAEGCDLPITESEVHVALTRLKNGKSAGLYSIKPILLKTIVKSIPEVFLRCINNDFRDGKFQWIFKFAKVTNLPKKTSQVLEAKDFRTILSSGPIPKLLELIDLRRIEFWAYKSNMFSTVQYGLEKDKTMTLALCDVCEFMKNDRVIFMFYDISKAYDNVDNSRLLKIMDNGIFPLNLVKRVHDFLTERKVVLKVDGKTYEKTMNNGIQQGSVLAPILWQIFFSDVVKSILTRLNNVLESEFRMYAYVDDLMITFKASTPGDRWDEKMINAVHKEVAEVMEEHNITLSPEKSVVMSNNRYTQKSLRTSPVKFDLPLVEEVKYLGVLLNPSGILSKNQTKTIGNVRSLVTQYEKDIHWIPWFQRKMIVLNILTPKLTHNIESLIDLHSHSNIMKWEEIHNRVLQLMFGIKTLLLNYRDVISVIGVLDIFSLAKLKQLNLMLKKGYSPFLKDGEKISLNIKRSRYVHPGEGRWFNIVKECKVYLDFGENANLAVYTDGSKDHKEAGFGVYAVSCHKEVFSCSKKVSKHAAVFDCELAAVIYGVNKAMEYNFNVVNIYTDSMSVLDALENENNQSSPVIELFIALQNLSRKANVSLYWTKGHGIEVGNITADYFARKGRIGDDYCPISVGEKSLKRVNKKFVYKIWQLQNVDTFINQKRGTEASVIGHKKKISNSVMRMLCGRPIFCNTVIIQNNGMCECGKSRQTFDHLLYHCPLFVDFIDDICWSYKTNRVDMFRHSKVMKMAIEMNKYFFETLKQLRIILEYPPILADDEL